MMIDTISPIEIEQQASKIAPSFDTLNVWLNKYRANKTIVHCHGVFDLLHIGHIRHFQCAREYGDIVVVSITPDIYVNKGQGKPVFTETIRAETIAALECVDYVIINQWPTAVETIKRICPHFYVKGDEYSQTQNDITGNIALEKNTIKSVGGQLVFTTGITFSSSSLINQFYSPYSQDMQKFLPQFKKKYATNSIFAYLQKAKDLKVLVVGEAIMDIYHFTDVIGKSGKEPILVAKHHAIEQYLGGSLALANHLSDFCQQITCLTYLGEKKEYEADILAGLKPNVNIVPVYKNNSPTIVKKRYLDNCLQQKLFEVYEINDDLLEGSQHQAFLNNIRTLSVDYDLVIAIDYGHGLFTEESIDLLTEKSRFLAVNTQSNAGNMGFNYISKYRRANYVSLANRELQLNYRQKHVTTQAQLSRLMSEHQYDTLMITCGKQGAYVVKQQQANVQVPAFTDHVIDRVGSGDAVLAISSLFAYFDAPAEVIAFIGSVVGAEAVGIMGNNSSIEKVALMKHISHLLK